MTKLHSLIIGFLLVSLSGCACWTDKEKMNTPACIVAHDVVDCTLSAVEGSIPYFVNIIGSLINGGMDPNNIPWDDIATQAEAMGIKDGGCLLAELKQLVFSKMQASPAMASASKKLSDTLDAYKKKHFGNTSVKFKIKTNDGKVVIL